MKCNFKYNINYIIILFTIFVSIIMLKNELDININKLNEMLYLFLSIIMYSINDFLSYSLIFVYLIYKLKNVNI